MDVLIDKYIMSLYQDLEDEVIADIARRVKKTGRYTETAELMAKSMHEQGYSPSKIQAEVMKMLRADKAYQMAVAENTKAYKQEIQDIIDETVKAAKEANDILVAEAGNMAWNNDLSMWEQHGEDLTKPNNMSQLISAARMQTMGALKNLTKTMGFRNTTLGTTGILNAYQRELDLALIKVTTGTFSFDQAVNDCVHRLAQSGLRSIDYGNGRAYQIDTAVRMSVRTGMSQLAGKVMEENLKNSGQDLVITSQHMGSRPEHVPWQNRVFSYSGKSKKYPDFFKETGYGTVEGLKGANCTHDFYPFWEGASVIPDDLEEPDPVEIDGKEYGYYHATQKQRQMERNIRAIKREIEAQNAIGGSTTELTSKLRAKTAEYKQFSGKAGLKVRDNRLRVEKGTSEMVKKKNVRQSVQTIRDENVLENIGKSGKIESKIFTNGDELNDFFYYDNPSQKGLLARKNSTYGKWKQSITSDEVDAMAWYTGDGYGDINDYWRKAKDWENIDAVNVQDASEKLDALISRFELKENIVVQRGVSENSLYRLLDQYNIEEDINELVGKKIFDAGYSSSTALYGNSAATSKPVIYEISVPAGIGRGAYINEFAGLFKDAEYEFLFKRDFSGTITDVVEDETMGKVIVKVVMDVE